MKPKTIELVSETDLGSAIYQVMDDGKQEFLLALGLWDRVNEEHSIKVKSRTKGQVVRIDDENNITAKSPVLEKIVYQVIPIDEDRILVSYRNGDMLYLNRDLSIKKHLNYQMNGIYSFFIDDNTLVAAMRDGGILYYDLDNDEGDVVQAVNPDVRMWSIVKDEDRIVAGSYKGDIVVVENKKVVKKIKVDEKPSAVWSLNRLGDSILAGTARGKMYSFNKDLEDRVLFYQNEDPITTANVDGQDVIIGDLKGNVHVVSEEHAAHYINPIKEKVPNTIWGMAVKNGSAKVAYSNGQLRTFRIK